jgi:hypothetical protein
MSATIRADFEAEIAKATTQSEIDAAIDRAIRAVSRLASAVEIAVALINTPMDTAQRGHD